MSVDVTDFLINEPKPFDSCWFSHKFRGPGLRYETGLAIELPKIVWANGPWPCGSYSDVRIFREGLKNYLRADEFVIADNGCTDERCIQTPGEGHSSHVILSLIRARDEILNKRLQQFGVLKQRFRHDLSLHRYCFFAVLQITQLIRHDEPLFQIQIE